VYVLVKKFVVGGLHLTMSVTLADATSTSATDATQRNQRPSWADDVTNALVQQLDR